jgi:hemerythrin
MPFITWDKSLSVNVKEIDLQHQQLILIINTLHDVMTKGKGKIVLGRTLEKLVEYAHYHFETEEKYFAKFHYPEAEVHIAQHHALTARVLDFQKKFESGDSFITIEVMEFLRTWLIEHIKGTDMRYTKCFNEHGLY